MKMAFVHTALAIGCAMLCACSEPQPAFRYLGKVADPSGLSQESYQPPAGMVTTPATAARIAETVAGTIYGEAQIRQQRPYIVRDTPTLWIVRGQLPKGSIGGVFEIAIRKRDGAIIHVIHGK